MRFTTTRAFVAAGFVSNATKTRNRVEGSITDITCFELFDDDLYSPKSIATH